MMRGDQIHQRHRALMLRDGFTWQAHPLDLTRGMWVPPNGIPAWDENKPVYPVPDAAPRKADLSAP